MQQATTLNEIDFVHFDKAPFKEILTHDAQQFLLELHKKFNSRRIELLENRKIEQAYFDTGKFPSFPAETKIIRESDWECASLPEDLLDRRVEITGPVSRKMVINAMNSGAKTFMADFEDSSTPSISNMLEGQVNLRDANLGFISFYNEKKNKNYHLNKNHAVLLVRPRGWHLNEKHFLVNGVEMSGSLVDFGLYFFHNIKTLLNKGTATYFYLPKLEHYLEARLWNEVFVFAQEYLNVPQKTIKATVLVETITASFQLDEIIYELKNHMAGLNCGRWDYIFSYIKKFRNHKGFSIPDRDQVTMKTHFMKSYSQYVIQRCHKRGVHAMGGMAAQIPIKNDDLANDVAFSKVIDDKQNEVKNGHDGTWVAHPALVPIAMEVFNEYMVTKNQIHVKRNDVKTTTEDLIQIPDGSVTEQGIRKNINVAILYIESWLSGNGAAALYNLMEDAATAEISRTQVWFWLKNKIKINDGRTFDLSIYETLKNEEIQNIINLVGEQYYKDGKFELAIQLFDELILAQEFTEFLTLNAYKHI